MINYILIILLWNSLISMFIKRDNTLCCGLIGFSGYKDKVYDLMKIKYLFYQNSMERGKDSTGYYTPITGIIKKAESAEKFLEDDKFKTLDSLLIGHVRYTTSGLTKDENAHPFLEGNVIGVHNGTLTNHWSQAVRAGLDLKDFNVDSQVLFAMIAKSKGFTALTKLIGAIAMICTDTTSEKKPLYCFRNSERTLYRGTCEEGMYISSIESSLKVIGCKDIKEFKEQYLYTIIDGKVIEKPWKMKKPVVEEVHPAIIDNRNKVIGFGYRETDVPSKLLVHKWIKCTNGKANLYDGKQFKITEGNWYLVRDTGMITKNDDYSIKIKDDEKKYVLVNKHYFDYKNADLKVKSYAILMFEIDLTEGNKKVGTIPKGSLLNVQKLWDSGEATVWDDVTKGSYDLDQSDLRPCDDDEAMEIMSKDTSQPIGGPAENDVNPMDLEDGDAINLVTLYIDANRPIIDRLVQFFQVDKSMTSWSMPKSLIDSVAKDLGSIQDDMNYLETKMYSLADMEEMEEEDEEIIVPS